MIIKEFCFLEERLQRQLEPWNMASNLQEFSTLSKQCFRISVKCSTIMERIQMFQYVERRKYSIFHCQCTLPLLIPIQFLAAMSSSRSDVVTQSVRSSFRTLFFLLVSWEFYLVLKSFNGVSRKS